MVEADSTVRATVTAGEGYAPGHGFGHCPHRPGRTLPPFCPHLKWLVSKSMGMGSFLNPSDTNRKIEFSSCRRDRYARRVSAELIGIIAVGAALVGVQVTVSHWIVSWLQALDGRVSHVEQRMARLEGLMEGAGLFRPAEALEPAAGD